MRTYKKIIKDSSFFPLSLLEIIELNKLCDAAKRLDNRNAIPATSSNFSIRSKNNALLITKSGLHKRNLNPSHFIRADFHGKPLHSQSPKPSDETLLHAMIYRNLTEVNAVLHCHATELEYISLEKSNLLPIDKNHHDEQVQLGYFKIPGHELLKALGLKSHLEDFYLPIIKNDQDIEKLSNIIETYFFSHGKKFPLCAFLLENHGIYCFGSSVQQAELKLEAILHLLNLLK